jgi:hypothetical protein
VLLAALEAGQELPLHAPHVDLVVVMVADGVGELLIGERVTRAAGGRGTRERDLRVRRDLPYRRRRHSSLGMRTLSGSLHLQRDGDRKN